MLSSSNFVLASFTIIFWSLISQVAGFAKLPSMPLNNIVADTGQGSHQHHNGMSHDHFTIPSGHPIPSVKIQVSPDPIRGWNLAVQVTNFRFAPEHASQENRLGEGHAHLYINGQKVARLYGGWYHIEKLQPGRNEIKVTLNTNSHETLIYNGQVIESIQVIEVHHE